MAEPSRYGTLSSGDASRRMSMSTLSGGQQYPQASISPVGPSSGYGYGASAPGVGATIAFNPNSLAGVEIDPSLEFGAYGGTCSSAGAQQPIQSAGDATPTASRAGRYGSSPGAGGGGRIGGASAEPLMTLRQSMAALGGDMPGRIGSTAAHAHALADLQSQSLGDEMPNPYEGTPLQGGGQQHHHTAAVADGRYGFISPNSDASASSTSTAYRSPAAGHDTSVSGGVGTQLTYDVEPFLLPSVPTKVRCLVFSLLSNWGDAYYVGLSGIEIFDGRGRRIVPPSPLSSSSSPSVQYTTHSTFDIVTRLGASASASSMGFDLRASCIAGASNLSNAAKLTSGTAHKRTTRDANEMFRMPVNFAEAIGLGSLGGGGVGVGAYRPVGSPSASSNNNALIWINFSEPVDISLIRIYNYNVGREQTFKGVQLMEILSSSSSSSAGASPTEQLLFRGEIAMASGDNCNEPEQILFVATNGGAGGEEAPIHGDAAAILSTIVAEDEAAAEALREKDPMMGVSPVATTAHTPSSDGGAPPQRASSPAPLSGSGGLAPPIVTSFHHQKALQRAESAGSSRGGSSGGTASAPAAVQPIVGLHHHAPPAGAMPSGPTSLRTGRIASANHSALRSSLAGGSIKSGRTAAESTTANKTVSFVSEGLSDAAVGGRGRPHHPAAADPASCPSNVSAVCIGILSTWGDAHHVGLSGIRFFTATGDLCFNVAHMAIARPPNAATGLSPSEAAALAAYDGEMTALTDGDATTACAWRFQEQMQIRIRFDPPVPSLGFIEIANYGISGSTQCGVKGAHIFVLSSPPSGSSSNNNNSGLAVFDQLWQSSTLPSGVTMLTTPEVPLFVRKSPSQLNILKHQSFDLSAAAGSSPLAGGDNAGGIRGAVAMTSSMTASMAARAKIEMRRARMSLLEGPPPQTEVPHGVAVATSLLPQGYVIKLELKMAAVAASAAELKPLLKTIIQEGMGGSAIVLYDEDCAQIPKELFSAAATLRHEGVSRVANHHNSGVYSPSTYNGGGILDGVGGSGGRAADVTASIVIDRGFREAIKAHENALQPPSEQAPTQERHTVSITFSFVFDIPTAISAVSHHFRALQSAQGRLLKRSPAGAGAVGASSASLASVRVLVDDETAFESLEFDMDSAAAAMLSGEADDLANACEPPPRCVAFVWDSKLLTKF